MLKERQKNIIYRQVISVEFVEMKQSKLEIFNGRLTNMIICIKKQKNILVEKKFINWIKILK